jgi:hypothetical protein
MWAANRNLIDNRFEEDPELKVDIADVKSGENDPCSSKSERFNQSVMPEGSAPVESRVTAGGPAFGSSNLDLW